MSLLAGGRASVFIACLGTLVWGNIQAQSFRTVSATRLAAGEASLNVRIDFAAGEVHLRPGGGQMLYRGEIYFNEDKFESVTDYDPDRRTLTFGLDTRNGGVELGRSETPQRMDLALSPRVPIRLDVELGAVEAHIELGGMNISAVDLKTGAADTRLSFSEPNRGHCRRIDLVAAAAEFHAEQLGNSGCETVRFEGGVGDITLDFTGHWARGDTRAAEIELGLGQLTLRLPRNLGVAIDMDRFLASFDRAGFRKSGSRYVSDGYEAASRKLHISVKAVLGDINIDWVEP